jgi:glutamine synthetase
LQSHSARARHNATNRPERTFNRLVDEKGMYKKISSYYGDNIFDFRVAKGIPEKVRKQLFDISNSDKKLPKEVAAAVADAVLEWALSKGATHFCHWFQPLTGSTAEKHDSFLNIRDGKAVEEFSASQLMQGEPDASSFPNGGSRSTFEARGYTTWDLTSPMFLLDGVNGRTLCIPTAFVSYTGQALDMKTPLLRSEVSLSQAVCRFMAAIDEEVDYVQSTCGAEQEYFLIDKDFYYARPDLVMTGRTLFGSLSTRNQQLDDHYFGAISERVMSFMQELDFELHLLGIPSKTRHNEVAPGQYELAPIFNNSNISVDNNMLIMATIKKVAHKHQFVALMHEKPFAGINGSGKHLNWSMSTSKGENLLNPGDNPETNERFLAVTASIIEAVFRHGSMIRASIASAGNDHRLGANEAPPSVISVYMGDTLGKIFTARRLGKEFNNQASDTMDMGAQQLADLDLDNTDRNRTSPFAFTGNKFELRACGSEMSTGLPLSILNAAIADVFCEAADYLEEQKASGVDKENALKNLTKKWLTHSHNVIFNGNGYSDAWLVEAQKRGLPNLKTTADALPVIVDEKENAFLMRQEVFTKEELDTRYNVLLERYITLRSIEFETLLQMIHQHVIPSVLSYKSELCQVLQTEKSLGIESNVEKMLLENINESTSELMKQVDSLKGALDELPEDEKAKAKAIAYELMDLANAVADTCNKLEEMIPSRYWGLPKYYDMLFLR